VPVLGTLGQEKKGQTARHGAADEEVARSVAVEEGADLHAEEEREEGESCGDPAYVSDGVFGKLVS
jgi:hypothetical protein